MKTTLGPPRILSVTHRVCSYEIDAQGRLAVDTICNLFQEVASQHAHLLGVGIEDLSQRNQFWALSQLSLSVSAYPGWGETLKISTWPSGRDRLFALRDFTVTTAADEPVASGISSWLVIDADARRPLRPETALAQLNPVTDMRATAPAPRRLSKPRGKGEQKRFQTRYRDLDVNHHMNNVRYIERVMESIPSAQLPRLRLKALQMNFLAEAFFGDTIISHTCPHLQNPLCYDHRLTREKDSRELARAQTAWIWI